MTFVTFNYSYAAREARKIKDALGCPVIWIPHSYPGCGQHGPDEHLPRAIAAEGLQIMAGLFWDIGHRGL